MTLVEQAIEDVRSGHAFFKYLSPNDSGETGGHQSGILVNRSCGRLLFDDPKDLPPVAKRNTTILWQDEFSTHAIFTWYDSKKEFRITGYKRNFELITPEDTGAVFILVKSQDDNYKAYVLKTDEEIDSFLSETSLTSTDAGHLIYKGWVVIPPGMIAKCVRETAYRLKDEASPDFPSSVDVSSAARQIDHSAPMAINDPSTALLRWTQIEYDLFRELEQLYFLPVITSHFPSVDDFLATANSMLNRRKSRAGKSLEHHTAEILRINQIEFEEQVVTEQHKTVDFLMPSGVAYRDSGYPIERIITLAAKTTCKDRWRQVISEASRMSGRPKYLLTLQQSMTASQLYEMRDEQVSLVVPWQYVKSFPIQVQSLLIPLNEFIRHVLEVQKAT